MRREFDIRVTSYAEEEFRVSGKDFKHLLEEYNRDQLYKKFGILFKKFVNDSLIDEDDSGTYIFTVVDSKKMSMLSLKHGITGSVKTITNVCQKVHDLL